jgi:L-Ala-D/L-Glu epimerase
MNIEFEVKAANFPLEKPFKITRHTFTALECVQVSLSRSGRTGRGEGDGVYFLGETQASMLHALEAVRPQVEAGITRVSLQQLLPAGGARNALDCALWDLEAKESGRTIWEEIKISPRQLTTVATIGLGNIEQMCQQAQEFSRFPHLKIKLDSADPIERLKAIRETRPDAKLIIDVNQGWEISRLIDLLPDLVELGINMIEQPIAIGSDSELASLDSPIPIGVDESCRTLEDYLRLRDLYQVVNIKLDKSGGLTEALAIARQAKEDGKQVMVGNMMGTSLSMAPAYVIGQLSTFVDIDGPLLLASDEEHGLEYFPGGLVSIPKPELWG